MADFKRVQKLINSQQDVLNQDKAKYENATATLQDAQKMIQFIQMLNDNSLQGYNPTVNIGLQAIAHTKVSHSFTGDYLSILIGVIEPALRTIVRQCDESIQRINSQYPDTEEEHNENQDH